jgi:hypothetical protein
LRTGDLQAANETLAATQAAAPKDLERLEFEHETEAVFARMRRDTDAYDAHMTKLVNLRDSDQDWIGRWARRMLRTELEFGTGGAQDGLRRFALSLDNSPFDDVVSDGPPPLRQANVDRNDQRIDPINPGIRPGDGGRDMGQNLPDRGPDGFPLN